MVGWGEEGKIDQNEVKVHSNNRVVCNGCPSHCTLWVRCFFTDCIQRQKEAEQKIESRESHRQYHIK